jgi:hypothetical protein
MRRRSVTGLTRPGAQGLPGAVYVERYRRMEMIGRLGHVPLWAGAPTRRPRSGYSSADRVLSSRQSTVPAISRN